MTVHYGFFNSSNGDRVYDAEDFSRFFDGIIFDGVYSAVGNRFNVEAATGMMVTVDTGRAWFDHTWTFNDQKLALTIPTADTVYNRIDAVVIEVNKDQRKNFIKVVKGTAASTPNRPTLTKTESVTQYALAYVTIPANSTQVSQNNIVYVVDSSETPLASALNLAGLPSGGTIGQVLSKKSATSGDVGWYDVDKLPIDKWYLADGMNEDQVIAAFKFVNRLNENQALAQVNEKHPYTANAVSLSKTGSPSWSSSTGFTIPWLSYLDNSTLRTSGCTSLIMRVTDITCPTVTPHGVTCKKALPLTGNCFTSKAMTIWASMPLTTDSFYWLNHSYLSTSGPYGSMQDSTTLNNLKSTGVFYTSGTIGYSKGDDVLYRNGAVATRTKVTSTMNGHAPSGFCAESPTNSRYTAKLVGGYATLNNSTEDGGWSDLDHWSWGSSFKIQYLALYSANLSQTQQNAIYQNIESDIAS